MERMEKRVRKLWYGVSQTGTPMVRDMGIAVKRGFLSFLASMIFGIKAC